MVARLPWMKIVAFIELARNVAHAVDETGETAKRVRVTK